MANDIERQNFLNEGESESEKFEKFKTEFEDKMVAKYGIGINDCTDEDQLRVEFKTGSTPDELVEFFASKHDLTPLKDM